MCRKKKRDWERARKIYEKFSQNLKIDFLLTVSAVGETTRKVNRKLLTFLGESPIVIFVSWLGIGQMWCNIGTLVSFDRSPAVVVVDDAATCSWWRWAFLFIVEKCTGVTCMLWPVGAQNVSEICMLLACGGSWTCRYFWRIHNYHLTFIAHSFFDVVLIDNHQVTIGQTQYHCWFDVSIWRDGKLYGLLFWFWRSLTAIWETRSRLRHSASFFESLFTLLDRFGKVFGEAYQVAVSIGARRRRSTVLFCKIWTRYWWWQFAAAIHLAIAAAVCKVRRQRALILTTRKWRCVTFQIFVCIILVSFRWWFDKLFNAANEIAQHRRLRWCWLQLSFQVFWFRSSDEVYWQQENVIWITFRHIFACKVRNIRCLRWNSLLQILFRGGKTRCIN